MNIREINKILKETAYVRTGGSPEELRCAQYIASRCSDLGLCATLEAFDVHLYTDKRSSLKIDGREVECKAFFGSPNGTVEAGLYYLEGKDKISIKKCRGKIVLIDGPIGYKLYDSLTEAGAVGVITYNGNFHYADSDVDQREIRFEFTGSPLPIVNINIKEAFNIVKNGCKTASITVEQTVENGSSYNVLLDIKGEIDEWIVFSAHYDSTLLSLGSYDNMSSCIALLALAESFSKKRQRRSMRFIWCGSEERGLLGSRDYCAKHAKELDKVLLNVNLDMLGSVMGGFVAFSCANRETTDFLERFISRHRFSATVRYGIRSSDSNSFVASGVPAVSFARYSPADVAPIHTGYDTPDTVSAKRLLGDIGFIEKFSENILNALDYPLPRQISDEIKEEVERYMERKKK